MTVTHLKDVAASRPGKAPVMVWSGDTHIGPRLNEDLRPYCPKGHLEAFDHFTAHKDEHLARGNERMFGTAEVQPGVAVGVDALGVQLRKNSHTAGHHDMYARLADYDRDGVAGGVLFHGSQNGHPIPFRSSPFESMDVGDDPAMGAIGYHIYNQWLAEVCQIQPERHVGIAYVPLWDIEAATKEVQWARKAGLRAVHFPAPIAGVAEYNRPEWEPFWSVVEDLDMSLIGHGGQDISWRYQGPEGLILQLIEGGGWMARRSMHWLAFSGVFHRHPKLRLVITEISGDWWENQIAEMDGVFMSAAGAAIRAILPELPSEAAKRCIWGAWWLCPHETRHAVEGGFSDKLMWGSDYPHLEGTWRWPEPGETTPQTQLHLRYAFGGLPEADVLRMTGRNAVKAYGLDAEALGRVARRINAMTLDDIRKPLPSDEIPTENPGLSLPFRKNWSWS